MDESFQLRTPQFANGAQPAPLAHDMLAMTLAAQQAASPAACAQARAKQDFSEGKEAEPLTELLLAGPDWQRAASTQTGCFNRIEVRRRLNPR